MKHTAALELDGIVPQHVKLSAGEVLYMPAGWYHEVHALPTSAHQGPGVRRDGADESGEGDKPAYARVHLALNAWIKPPGKKKRVRRVGKKQKDKKKSKRKKHKTKGKKSKKKGSSSSSESDDSSSSSS
mmetsp:Transcript_27858/g.54798  ORF Transcript_27858/g.54798 Transcript_27858/m.54798 type:complete len:129 (-) Transcript_27858:13-399(-)